jgi:hypothetical protein
MRGILVDEDAKVVFLRGDLKGGNWEGTAWIVVAIRIDYNQYVRESKNFDGHKCPHPAATDPWLLYIIVLNGVSPLLPPKALIEVGCNRCIHFDVAWLRYKV